jgi:hypothetical protein
MTWNNERDICLISTAHDDKMISSRFRGQDMEKPKVVVDYNSGMGCVDPNDKLCSTRKRQKKNLSKALVI